MEVIPKNDQITFCSLYSGCGGLDLGFLQAGAKGVGSFDHDSDSVNTLKDNLKIDAHKCDLTLWDDSVLSAVASCDVLIAGPPCQGFSTAGKNNPQDARNDHLSNVARIAAKSKPKIVLIENVKGVLSPKNSEHLNKTKSILKDAGYTVTVDTHDSSEHGVAQSRKRVFIMATNSNEPKTLNLKCEERVSLSDVLRKENSESDNKKFLCRNSNEFKIARRILPGHKLSNVRRSLLSVHTWEIPEVFGSVSSEEVSLLETIVKLRRQKRRRSTGDADPVDVEYLEQLFGNSASTMISSLVDRKYLRWVGEFIDITNTFNGKFRRLKWDEISPTVHTRFGQPRYFLHPDDHRGFTIREAARIQSFPDKFVFHGSEASKFKMIGNAVPPKLANAVANDVIRVWKNL